MPINITARIEDQGLAKTLARATPQIKKRAFAKVRAAAFALVKRIKETMPVLTGRAKASWGKWTPGDLKPADKDASESDALFEERPGSLSVVQGTNVPYVQRLNEGHSQQAPAGFIDAGAVAAARELQKELAELADEVFK